MKARRLPGDQELILRARQMRHDMTGPERKLWYALRDRRLADRKFRRQVVIGPYIVDFYCHAARLILEIDGDSHDGRAKQDHARQPWIEAQGLRVIRISNDDVLHDLEGVVEGIVQVLKA